MLNRIHLQVVVRALQNTCAQSYSLASESFAKHIFQSISVLQSNGKCNMIQSCNRTASAIRCFHFDERTYMITKFNRTLSIIYAPHEFLRGIFSFMEFFIGYAASSLRLASIWRINTTTINAIATALVTKSLPARIIPAIVSKTRSILPIGRRK